MSIKQCIKQLVPVSIKNLIRPLQFALIYKKTYNKYCKKKNEKMKVVFLVERKEIWNSFETVYRAALKRENIDVYLIALSRYIDGKFYYDIDEIFEFCKEIAGNENVILAYNKNSNKFIDLSKLKPDYVFVPTPYDGERPEEFSMKDMSSYAKICYIPYGYTLVKSKLQETNLPLRLLKYAYFIFAESKVTYDYCKKRLRLSEMVTQKRVIDLGFPRFDLYRDLAKQQNKKNILWLPRWTTKYEEETKGNEESSFLRLKDEILIFAQENSDLNFIIRPHPLLFSNHIDKGYLTEEEANDYKNKIDTIKNVELDNSPSYIEAVLKADVLIADFSSVVAEFFVTEKPIIYLGSGDNFKEDKEIYNTFYHAKDWKDVATHLQNLLNNEDVKKENRKVAVEHFFENRKIDSGEAIINCVVEDYLN